MRFDGEHWTRRVHQDAEGIAAQQHLAHCRTPPDADDAEPRVQLVQDIEHLLGGLPPPHLLPDGERHTSVGQRRPHPVEVCWLRETRIAQRITAGGVHHHHGHLAVRSLLGSCQQRGAASGGWCEAHHNGHCLDFSRASGSAGGSTDASSACGGWTRSSCTTSRAS